MKSQVIDAVKCLDILVDDLIADDRLAMTSYIERLVSVRTLLLNALEELAPAAREQIAQFIYSVSDSRLLDEFAMSALTGLLAADPNRVFGPDDHAQVAFELADAMLLARSQKENKND